MPDQSFLDQILVQILVLDRQLFVLINQVWTNLWMDSLFTSITDIHKSWFFKFIFVPWMASVFIRQYRAKGIILFLGLLLAVGSSDLIGARVIKPAFARERPSTAVNGAIVRSVENGGFSFVSNHAFNSFTIATYCLNWIPQGRVLFLGLAGLIAYSRVYVGVHFPADVTAGSILGILLGTLAAILFEKLTRLRRPL